MSSPCVVVPWHDPAQRERFCAAWGLTTIPAWVRFEQDASGAGCARTKNRGVAQAMDAGYDVVAILDDDCEPDQGQSLEAWLWGHVAALEPVVVPLFAVVTDPPSRGTPYFTRTVPMPVAASMGYWRHIGDYDAPSQLVRGATTPMRFMQCPIFGKYFALCGMNLAFRPADWLPWCQFIDVPRFDDIWMGWLWQKAAYRRGACFNLQGPIVRHSRQSNVWQNLRDEATFLEANDRVWATIALATDEDYDTLRRMLPA